MQEKLLYEYATIRIVPKVEREEFVNVGVILFCKQKKYIKMKVYVNEQKLSLFSSELEICDIYAALAAFEEICNGNKNRGSIAQMDVPERFRWLTAVRSSCLQTSRPHPGLADDLDSTLNELFHQLVL